MVPATVTLAVLGFALFESNPGYPDQPRFVEDEAVLAPKRVRVAAGAAFLVMTYPGVSDDDRRTILGGGWNLETAIGLGRGLEVGARVGLRDQEGRAVHADQAARVLDTETFGTGLGTVANPELRLRGRLFHRGPVEAGVEERVVFPVPRYLDVGNVLGAWASLHGERLWRLDLGLNAVLIWRSFSAGRELQPGLGLPVRFHVSITSGLFASVFATTHHMASTASASAHTSVTVGAGLGYRYRACDILAAYQRYDVFADDVLQGSVDRTGLGLGLSCRPW